MGKCPSTEPGINCPYVGCCPYGEPCLNDDDNEVLNNDDFTNDNELTTNN